MKRFGAALNIEILWLSGVIWRIEMWQNSGVGTGKEYILQLYRTKEPARESPLFYFLQGGAVFIFSGFECTASLNTDCFWS